MTVTVGRDLDMVRRGLETWLRERRRRASGLRVEPLRRASEGLSSETLLAEARWEERGRPCAESLVVRMPPAGPGLFPSYDLATQAVIQQRLELTNVPVASPVTYEPDPAWVGAPFLTMPRVRGRVLSSQPSFIRQGWLREAQPADQARLYRCFLDVLAAVHRFDWRGSGLGFLIEDGTSPLDAQTRWWSHYLDWALEDEPVEGLAEGMRWCERNRPDPEPPASLLWGDVQLLNAVFGDDMRPAAILDWEMASVGPAEQDLGWFLALRRMTVDVSGEDLPVFPGRQESIDHYAASLGRRLADLRWFEAFALVRSGAILARIARVLAASGVDDSWLGNGIPQVRLLEEIT